MTNMNELIGKVRQWGEDKGITGPNGKASVHTQFAKLEEEAEELERAILDQNHAETIDAIGDMTVVLILLAELAGTNYEHCLQTAYDVISKRTGRMIDGQFVKDKAEVAE